MIKAGFFIS